MNLSLHNSSLRRRLIFMLSGITLIIWLFSIVTGWVTLRKEIHELFDNQLVFFLRSVWRLQMCRMASTRSKTI